MIDLIPILAKKVYNHRNLFRLALSKAVPPFIVMTDAKANKVIKSMEKGEMTGWLVYDEEKVLLAVAITKIVEDQDLGTKDLLLYCVYALEKLTLQTWDEAFKQMSEYGLKLKCTAMTAYTRIDKVKQMAERMGGNTEMVYCNIPLKR